MLTQSRRAVHRFTASADMVTATRTPRYLRRDPSRDRLARLRAACPTAGRVPNSSSSATPPTDHPPAEPPGQHARSSISPKPVRALPDFPLGTSHSRTVLAVASVRPAGAERRAVSRPGRRRRVRSGRRRTVGRPGIRSRDRGFPDGFTACSQSLLSACLDSTQMVMRAMKVGPLFADDGVPRPVGSPFRQLACLAQGLGGIRTIGRRTAG
jgi:hypothetical protein